MLKQEGLKEGACRTVQGFCESTSLHGYSYLNNANSNFLKFFWFLVITVTTSFGLVLLVQNTIEYLNANIVTTIQSSNSDLKVSIKLRFLIVFHFIYLFQFINRMLYFLQLQSVI
jgi:hypothetical protein